MEQFSRYALSNTFCHVFLSVEKFRKVGNITELSIISNYQLTMLFLLFIYVLTFQIKKMFYLFTSSFVSKADRTGTFTIFKFKSIKILW